MFPFAQLSATQMQRETEAPPELARPARVLILESDPRVLRQMTVALAQAGHRVHGCYHAGQAKEACRQHSFDLIISDWLVDHQFADEILLALHAVIRPRALPPVVVLSSLGEEDTRECLRPDVTIDTILTRPVDPRRRVQLSEQLTRRGDSCQNS